MRRTCVRTLLIVFACALPGPVAWAAGFESLEQYRSLCAQSDGEAGCGSKTIDPDERYHHGEDGAGSDDSEPSRPDPDLERFRELTDQARHASDLEDKIRLARRALDYHEDAEWRTWLRNAEAEIAARQSRAAYEAAIASTVAEIDAGFRQLIQTAGGNRPRNPGAGLALMAADAPVDASVVDARNVPTGLPKFVEDTIPNTPAGNRLRKAFQAVMAHDWNVAVAWFKDALNHDPGNPGLMRLVDLAEFTQQRRHAAAGPIQATSAPGESFDQAIRSYAAAHPEAAAAAQFEAQRAEYENRKQQAARLLNDKAAGKIADWSGFLDYIQKTYSDYVKAANPPRPSAIAASRG